MSNATDRFKFDYIQFPTRAPSSSNFLPECSNLRLLCALCSVQPRRVHSIECECANLFDTRTFRSHFFPSIGIAAAVVVPLFLFASRAIRGLSLARAFRCLFRAFLCREPRRCIHFSFLCRTKFRLCVPWRCVLLTVVVGRVRLAFFVCFHIGRALAVAGWCSHIAKAYFKNAIFCVF